MTTINLYTGGGVTFSPDYAEGRVESSYVRLVADDGKAIQKGDIVTLCADVPASDVANWTEIDEPEPQDDLTAEEIAAAIEEVLA